jgi:phosphohistidine phosphatase
VTLYILRHGIAEEMVSGGDDGARPLTSRGRIRIRAAARGMHAIDVRLDVLLTSPMKRAAETAAIVAEVYGGRPVPRMVPALTQGTQPVETLRALRPFLRDGDVMVVGHEPGLSGLASLLLIGSPDGASIALKKGGLIALELRERAPATLRFMVTPRQLRRLGR